MGIDEGSLLIIVMGVERHILKVMGSVVGHF